MIQNPNQDFKERSDTAQLVDLDAVNECVGMPRVVTELENGRMVSKVVFEITPVEKLNEGLKVDDFAIENLITNGYQFKRFDYDGMSFDSIDHLTLAAGHINEIKKKVESPKNN